MTLAVSGSCKQGNRAGTVPVRFAIAGRAVSSGGVNQMLPSHSASVRKAGSSGVTITVARVAQRGGGARA
jgi:hypothetical protein